MKYKKLLLALIASLCVMPGIHAQATEMSAQEIILAVKDSTLVAQDTVVYDGATYKVIELHTTTNPNPEALPDQTQDTTREYYSITCRLEKPALWAGIEIGTDYIEIRAEEGIEPLSPLCKVKNADAGNNKKHMLDIRTWTRNNDMYYKLERVREFLQMTGFTTITMAAYTLTAVGLSNYLRGK